MYLLESRDDGFSLLVEYFEAGVLHFINPLQLFDDELAVHDEMDFCASEFCYSGESEDGSHILRLIIGGGTEEKFAGLYDFFSFAHDKSAPARAGVSPGSSIGMNGVEHGQSFLFFL